VHESVADKYLEGLIRLMKTVELGDPFAKSTFQGCVQSPDIIEGYYSHLLAVHKPTKSSFNIYSV
jgi:hypothetical protein